MSKFAPISDLLQRRSGTVEISMEDLSNIVPGGLPKSAYKWEVWWGNNDNTHPQSQSWGAAGYDAYPDLSRRSVRFVPRN